MNKMGRQGVEMQKGGIQGQMVDSEGLPSLLSAFFCTTSLSTKLEIGEGNYWRADSAELLRGRPI